MGRWVVLVLVAGCFDPIIGMPPDVGTDTGIDAGPCGLFLADCDGNGSCDTDLREPETCGSCTTVCLPGQLCSSMRCVGDPLDASVDTRLDVSSADAGGCTSGRWPGAPTPDTEGANTATRVWALKDIVYDQSGGLWRSIGWDLDGVCTSSLVDDFHPCTPPGEPVPPLDGSNGIDNAFGESILSQIVMFDSAFEVNARQAMENGESILILLGGWNGEDDDPSVAATMIQALGVNRVDGEGLPQWDGDDRWIQADTSFVGGDPDTPNIFNDNAYVRGGTLVFQLPDRRPIILPWVNDNHFELSLIDARITATISPDRTRLDRVFLTGRYPRVELSMNLERSGICEGTVSRALIDGLLEDELDVRDPVGSGTGPSVACNAISVAFELTGYIAELDTIGTPPAPQPVDCLP